MGDALATVGATIFIARDALAGRVDGDVEGSDEVQAILDIAFRPRHIQHEVPFLLGRHLRTVDVDDEVVVLDQMIDDRLLLSSG